MPLRPSGRSSTAPSPTTTWGCWSWLFAAMVGVAARRRRAVDGGTVAVVVDRRGADPRPAHDALPARAQSMPLAFFTRTQTGSLITRLNNDVIGAQRALTGTLGGIVDNAHRGDGHAGRSCSPWSGGSPCSLVSLLPLFIIPARIVGDGSRRSPAGHGAQRRDEHRHDRALPRRRGAARQAVRPRDREVELFHDKAERVADIGVKQAMYRPGAVRLARARRRAGDRAGLPRRRAGRDHHPSAIQVGTVVALGMYVTQLYGPLAQLSNARVDLMTALVSFERVFEVLDLPRPIEDATRRRRARPTRAATSRFEDVWFRYPAATGRPRVAGGAARRARRRRLRLDPARHRPRHPARRRWSRSSALGRRQVDPVVARPAPVRRHRGPVTDRRPRRARPDARLPDRAVGVVSQDPHLFHDSIATTCATPEPDATDEELVARPAAPPGSTT
jgi:ATP-binding cassette, subfamily B, bacterial